MRPQIGLHGRYNRLPLLWLDRFKLTARRTLAKTLCIAKCKILDTRKVAMPQRAKSICRRTGCSVLLDAPGYCPAHTVDRREPFRALDERKTDEVRGFYSSAAWTAASRRHRAAEPLCRRCRAAGRVVPADMVHHNPPREELVARGLSPLDDQFLESLCNPCHMGELRAKRGHPTR
jgi:hypothetical protein